MEGTFELASGVACSLAESLPGDGTEASWAGGGVRVAVYRCSRLQSTHKGFRGEVERVLTGGVQIVAMTDLPLYGPRTVNQSRLRVPWTRETLERRLCTEIEKIRAQRVLDVARDAVFVRCELLHKSAYFEREWLRHARAHHLPLLIDVAQMSLEEAQAWSAWLALRS